MQRMKPYAESMRMKDRISQQMVEVDEHSSQHDKICFPSSALSEKEGEKSRYNKM